MGQVNERQKRDQGLANGKSNRARVAGGAKCQAARAAVQEMVNERGGRPRGCSDEIPVCRARGVSFTIHNARGKRGGCCDNTVLKEEGQSTVTEVVRNVRREGERVMRVCF